MAGGKNRDKIVVSRVCLFLKERCRGMGGNQKKLLKARRELQKKNCMTREESLGRQRSRAIGHGVQTLKNRAIFLKF